MPDPAAWLQYGALGLLALVLTYLGVIIYRLGARLVTIVQAGANAVVARTIATCDSIEDSLRSLGEGYRQSSADAASRHRETQDVITDSAKATRRSVSAAIQSMERQILDAIRDDKVGVERRITEARVRVHRPGDEDTQS